MLDAPSLTRAPFGRVWIHSDLQLAEPHRAREVFTAAVDDILDLNLDLAAAWCLGDALSGRNEAALEEVAAASLEQLDRLGVPICYVMGNHEMDLRRAEPFLNRYPLYEAARQRDDWHTMDQLSDFYFVRECFGTLVVFMGDHADSDGRWWTSHGAIKDDTDAYPHTPSAYAALRDTLAAWRGPVVTVSHYAYPGGQRPSALMGRLLPLPANVRLHLYGHAHIGDLVHNKERPWQRDNPIDGQTRPRQFNISALETIRSPGSHSAVLDFGPEGPTTLRIRCHLQRRWVETFDLTCPHAEPATTACGPASPPETR